MLIRLSSVLLVLGLVFAAGADLFPAIDYRLAGTVAAAEDAAAMWANPAAAGLPRGFCLGGDFTVGTPKQTLWDIYMGGILGGLGYKQFSLDDGAEHLLGTPITPKSSTLSDFTWSPSFGSDLGALGFGLHWLSTDNISHNHAFTWSTGIIARPWRYLSLGFVVDNWDEPLLAGTTLARSYTAGLGFRPFTDKVTLTADAHFDRDFATDNLALDYGITAEPLPGLSISGVFRPEAKADNMPNGFSTEGSNFAFSLGLDSSYFGVGYTRAGGSGDIAPAGNIVSLRFTSQRIPSIVNMPDRYTVLNIGDSLNDTKRSWSLLGGGGGDLSLQSAIEQLKTVEKDGELAGVILRINNTKGWIGIPAQAEELHRQLLQLRKSGKKVVAFIEDPTGPTPYYIATAADSIVMPQEGTLSGLGVFVQLQKVGEAADKLGVAFDTVAAGKYKLTFNPLASGISDDERKEAQEIVDSQFNVLINAIVDGRRMDEKRVRELCTGLPMSAVEAKDVGLIDNFGDWYECRKVAGKLIGKGRKPVNLVNVQGWEYATQRWAEPPKVAVILMEGSIHRGESASDFLFGGKSIGSETIVEQLEKCEKDSDIKAVVLRIDSGGGDVLASAYIYEAVERIKDKGKPVVASYSSVSASGGYYISCGCDSIIADETTITGSIGVFDTKLVIKGLFEKLGITAENIKSNQSADIVSSMRKLTDEERAKVQKLVDEIYRGFVQKVADGRKMSYEDVDKIAQGRVWTGNQAKEIGLIDEIGGLEEAVKKASSLAKLSEKPDVVYYSGSWGMWRRIGNMTSLFWGLTEF